jgi:hypothetical protein
MTVFESIEQALAFGRYRSGLLASDVANANTPGFAMRDATLDAQATPGGMRFAAALHDVEAGSATATVEYAMGASAKNAVWYRALAAQAHALLRELRTVAEESRR